MHDLIDLLRYNRQLGRRTLARQRPHANTVQRAEISNHIVLLVGLAIKRRHRGGLVGDQRTVVCLRQQVQLAVAGLQNQIMAALRTGEAVQLAAVLHRDHHLA